MIENLRRLYNSIDRLFDRKYNASPREIHFTRDGGQPGRVVTARQAFDRVYPLVQEQDRDARLKMIVSQHGMDKDGASAHWEFFFDLIQRRAQVVAEWKLAWDEEADDYGAASIDVQVGPFPPVGSPIRKMVDEGKLLHLQIAGLWEQECRRRPDIPNKFQDSAVVLKQFVKQGLDLTLDEFSLCTGQSPDGRTCWIAQTRSKNYFAAVNEWVYPQNSYRLQRKGR